ncbi:hypothetical protein AVEN_115514-1 [Araneus ventricosus]|uniref:Uncharacterized protein n=1 Tax=Araneus ventricosus TaxID=182803 RepID=A0A4Y2CIY3_ARAVE|nr:hypothetical protein AVEN_115514-1 [Araneus ventricosus]
MANIIFPSVHKPGRSIAGTSHYSSSTLLSDNEQKRHQELYHTKPFIPSEQGRKEKRMYLYIFPAFSLEFSTELYKIPETPPFFPLSLSPPFFPLS